MSKNEGSGFRVQDSGSRVAASADAPQGSVGEPPQHAGDSRSCDGNTATSRKRKPWRERPWYPIVFMFIVTAVPSLFLIGLSQHTQGRVKANEQLAFEKAVLLAVNPDLPETTAGMALHRQFLDTIDTNTARAAGALCLMEQGTVKAYALPFEGQGFWAPIKGAIGIAPDRTTVLGIYFYEQSETPGLGAEIVQPWFCANFRGKTLAAGAKPIVFRRRGEATGPNEVEAVTGGTQTSTRLENLLNTRIEEWRAAMAATTN